MSNPKSVTLDDALDAARKAKGSTVLALVSPRQAERLYLALVIADLVIRGATIPNEIAARYAELS